VIEEKGLGTTMLGLRLALNKDLSWMPRLDGSVEWKIYWTDSTRRQKKS